MREVIFIGSTALSVNPADMESVRESYRTDFPDEYERHGYSKLYDMPGRYAGSDDPAAQLLEIMGKGRGEGFKPLEGAMEALDHVKKSGIHVIIYRTCWINKTDHLNLSSISSTGGVPKEIIDHASGYIDTARYYDRNFHKDKRLLQAHLSDMRRIAEEVEARPLIIIDREPGYMKAVSMSQNWPGEGILFTDESRRDEASEIGASKTISWPHCRRPISEIHNWTEDMSVIEKMIKKARKG